MHKIEEVQNAVIIDVREPFEFAEANHPGSINFPLSNFKLGDYVSYKNRPIIFICQTQTRSIKAGEMLQRAGFNNIFILKNGMNGLLNDGAEVTTSLRGWTIDRQFRMVLGILLLIFLLGFNFISSYFIIIPILLSIGLIFTSIIDNCFMRNAIGRLPWNKGKKL